MGVGVGEWLSCVFLVLAFYVFEFEHALGEEIEGLGLSEAHFETASDTSGGQGDLSTVGQTKSSKYFSKTVVPKFIVSIAVFQKGVVIGNFKYLSTFPEPKNTLSLFLLLQPF